LLSVSNADANIEFIFLLRKLFIAHAMIFTASDQVNFRFTTQVANNKKTILPVDKTVFSIT